MMDPMMGGMGGMDMMGGGMGGPMNRGGCSSCDPCAAQTAHIKYSLEHTVGMLIYAAACICIFLPLASAIPYASNSSVKGPIPQWNWSQLTTDRPVALWAVTFISGLQAGVLGATLCLWERSHAVHHLSGESIKSFFFWLTIVLSVFPILLIALVYKTVIPAATYETGAILQTAGGVSAVVGSGSEMWIHRAENPMIGTNGGRSMGATGEMGGYGMGMDPMMGGMGGMGYGMGM